MRPSCPLWFKYPGFNPVTTRPPLGKPERGPRTVPGSDSKIRVIGVNPRLKYFTLNHPLPQVVLTLFFLCVFFAFFASFAVNIRAQIPDPSQEEVEFLTQKIATGSVEAKRDALYRIRNYNSVETSKIALPALKDIEEIVRATATHSILALPSDEAFDALIPLIKDKSAYVREEAAYAIGKTKVQRGVDPLIQLLKKDKEDEVRGAAAFGLGLIGDVRADDALIEALMRKKNIFAERSAARSLGQVKSRKAVVSLISVLRDTKRHDDVRREAAWALGEIGDASAVDTLRSFENGEDYLLGRICRESLQKLTESHR